MNKITLEAKGKINLLLDITARRENGYHDIVTIMQSVKLSDSVTVEKTDDGKVVLETDFDSIVPPEDNIATKALMLMKEEFSLDCGFRATIKKNIPIAGGMGGGSTNAAAVIKAVNVLCDLKQSTERLMQLGLKLGADVPFCIFEKCALARGVGEELSETDGLKDVKIVIVNPLTSVSTKLIYELADEQSEFGKINVDAALKALKAEDIQSFAKTLKNIMQPITEKLCPRVSEITKKLSELGAVHSMMSGSGPTCFGIFKKDAELEKIREVFCDCFVAVTEPL